MTRDKKIASGKVWQVYPNKDLDNVLFEGSRTACQKFIRANCRSAWRIGAIRLGKLIYEPQTK